MEKRRKRNRNTTKPKKATKKLSQLNEMNEKHAVLMLNGKTVILNEEYDPTWERIAISFSSEHDFKLRYSNEKVEGKSKTKFWLEHSKRRQYDGVIFKPYSPKESDVIKLAHEKHFNYFRGWPVTPVKGDCELYWEHVRKVICDGNDELYVYVRKYMAHAVQFPQDLPGVALVLIGKQGTGKDMFVGNFGKLFGQHYCVVHSMDQVAGRFNGHLADIIILHANEACWDGKKKNEGILKGLITDPITSMEKKFQDIVQVKNFKRLIVCSNESNPVPVGLDDRRFLLLNVGDQHKEDGDYFGALVKQMESGGLEALMYDLINEDLAGFDVRGKPELGNMFDLKMKGAGSEVKWWHEFLEDGKLWGKERLIVAKDELYNLYSFWCQRHSLRPIDKSLLFKEFRKLTPEFKDKKSSDIKGRIRYIHLPHINECRKHFEEYMKSNIDWPE